MVRLIESLGDRMLRLAVPKVAASAVSTAACEWSVVCRQCDSSNCASYQYRWQCCTGSGCKCLRYRACPCFIGCPC